MHYFCIFICIWIEWQFHFPQCRLSCIPIQLMTTINITRTMKMVRANGNERCGKWLNYHATHFQLRKKKTNRLCWPSTQAIWRCIHWMRTVDRPRLRKNREPWTAKPPTNNVQWSAQRNMISWIGWLPVEHTIRHAFRQQLHAYRPSPSIMPYFLVFNFISRELTLFSFIILAAPGVCYCINCCLP